MASILNKIEKASSDFSPENAFVSMREFIQQNPNLMGRDGKPVHWMVMDVSEGLLVCDSAYILAKNNCSGIKFRIASNSIMLNPEQMVPVFEKILDWLGLNIPESKTWSVEFKNGCPIIPVNREIIEG